MGKTKRWENYQVFTRRNGIYAKSTSFAIKSNISLEQHSM